VSRWDARGWVASVMDLGRDDLTLHSVDRYGASETQVRYEHNGEVVARLTVVGPVLPAFTAAGQGHWEIRAQIGAGTQDVHLLELPEADEIIFE
jgi:hypothetical protein